MVDIGIFTEFSECWRISWRTPFVIRLVLSAGLGGLQFGYITGVIAGALLYIEDDFKSVERKAWLKETIVSMTVAGAIIGAAAGGWISDRFGRKKSILIADGLFLVGSVFMLLAQTPSVIIIGRTIVGLGVGMVSVTIPLYISEASPYKIRGALVSINGFLITSGQFLSYLINLVVTHGPRNWRLMLGISIVPAIVQFIFMLSLPESPRWLFRNRNANEAKDILERIYPAEEVDEEIHALLTSLALENNVEGGLFETLRSAWKNDAVRRGLYAGVTAQVAQQFVGISILMYYSPTIIQVAGFESNEVALALSLITSGLNALGSIVSICLVDRYGRRRLMIISMIGIILSLIMLSVVFFQVSARAPKVSWTDTRSCESYGANLTCQAYIKAIDAPSWSCTRCLRNEFNCAFCAAGNNNLHGDGACLAVNVDAKHLCHNVKNRTWYTQGCPSKFGFWAIIFLGLYIIVYSPGMGAMPWILNSEIYPLKYRGLCGGIAAVSNWCSNLVVSQTFLTLSEYLSTAGTFLLYAGFSLIGLVFIFFLVPETKGLPFEEVERLLERGYSPFQKNVVNGQESCGESNYG